jgi:hypothetical protein
MHHSETFVLRRAEASKHAQIHRSSTRSTEVNKVLRDVEGNVGVPLTAALLLYPKVWISGLSRQSERNEPTVGFTEGFCLSLTMYEGYGSMFPG